MLDLRNITEGEKLHHHLHGIVKFVKFNYGTCFVLKENCLTNTWDKITVMSYNLTKSENNLK